MSDYTPAELSAEAQRLISENAPSENQVGMHAMHEMYTELVSAGFKENEALWLIGYVISGGSYVGFNSDD